MFQSSTVILTILGYIAVLFALALWVEKKAHRGVRVVQNPVIYSLALAVYFTAWTYYGSPGAAARSGLAYLAVYVGPMLSVIVWWSLVRRMIRIKNRFRVTSIADFISARYGMRQYLAALVTLIAVIGAMPYIALQLKAVITTFGIITSPPGALTSLSEAAAPRSIGLAAVAITTVFTIFLGARRLDPTERHEGIVAVVAMESLVKLVAMLMVGIFVTYGLFDGFGDLFSKLAASPYADRFSGGGNMTGRDYMSWMTYVLLSMFAIIFLPRQFHLGVVENSDERHVRTAMWLFPAYMLLINVFVIPIAAAGLLMGLPESEADTFVLILPMQHGNPWRALMVFVGGFSAATSMVMISSMTLATMLTNHLLMPLFDYFRVLGGMRRHMLKWRWCAIGGVILTGFWFEQHIGAAYMLANIGIISFAAIIQFAPAILGGMFWRRGNRAGAVMGLSAGFGVWLYTLLFPAFIESGWLSGLSSVMSEGPFGVAMLRPHNLLGVSMFPPVTQSLFWSMIVNGGLYILGSLALGVSREDQETADTFVNALEPAPRLTGMDDPSMETDLLPKRRILESLLGAYFTKNQVRHLVDRLLVRCGCLEKPRITLLELASLYSETEALLAGSFGTAAAHTAMKSADLYTEDERDILSKAYARILTDLRVSPQELRAKVDYYKEKHELVTRQARELEKTLAEKGREIAERERVERRLSESEQRYRQLVEQSPVATFIHVDGRIVFVNQVGVDMLGGAAPAEIIDRSILDFIPPEHHEALQNQQENATEFPFEQPLMEQPFVRLDGSRVDVEIKAIPYVYRRQKGYQVVAIDISERKRAEQQRRMLEAQIRQQQKLESLGTLASGIAHEINNPVNAIMNYGQLIADRLHGDERLTGFAREIVHESERISKIVYNLLAFARQERDTYDPVDIAHVVDDTMTLIRTVIKKDRITLSVDVPESLPPVRCHAQQIQQVLMNLVTNARDAVNEKFGEKGDKRIAISGATHADADGRWLRLTVEDNGPGIAEPALSRLFDPFFTTKSRGEGTGLGLSVSHGIVREHNGRLLPESEPGRFARFHVDLPLEGETFENGE